MSILIQVTETELAFIKGKLEGELKLIENDGTKNAYFAANLVNFLLKLEAIEGQKNVTTITGKPILEVKHGAPVESSKKGADIQSVTPDNIDSLTENLIEPEDDPLGDPEE